jgi:hypothetical protein
MAVSERSLSYQDALKEGLALPKDIKDDTEGVFSVSHNRTKDAAATARYLTTIGGGNIDRGLKVISENQIKPEEFWRSTFNSFTTQWLPSSKKNTIENIEKQTQAIKERTGREVGSQRATTMRAARATSGMLSGAKSPAMGASGSGPMLGGDSMLGEESMLGSRRRM